MYRFYSACLCFEFTTHEIRSNYDAKFYHGVFLYNGIVISCQRNLATLSTPSVSIGRRVMLKWLKIQSTEYSKLTNGIMPFAYEIHYVDLNLCTYNVSLRN